MAASELLLNILAFTLCFVVYSNLNIAEASRLNVPRVLLPIFNDFPVNFTLEVTEGGCYQWSTSRLDVIHLIPMNENTERTCSSAVLVQTVIKDSSRNTAIVLAEDINTGQFLRCDVIVDAINSLNMVTTTRELFIEEAPEAFEVRAYDEQGNEFTTLAGIEFEWTIANGERHIVDNNFNENDILRFMTFQESPYETPSTVSMLDGSGKYGSIILLEGVKTGTAQVSAKLPYNEYKQVSMVEVELIVVANLIILPSDVTMMAYDSFFYKIMQVHQGRLEGINLPSSQYYLIAEQPDILEIDNVNYGKAYALKEGKSKVLLHDKNVNEEYGVVLPTANVHIASVKYIMITLLPNKNNGMILGQYHEIVVELFSEKDHKFHIGEGIEVSVEIDDGFIDTKSITKNGTYIIGVPITCGKTIIEANLHGVVDKYGKRVLLPIPLYAKTEFTIHTPVIVNPKILAVPWDPNSKSRFDVALKATGGDGTYSWTSRHSKIAAVSQNGVIRILSQGTTNIVVSMASNQFNRDVTILHVMLPTRLEIIHYNMDAAIGELIHLHIALYGKINTESPNGTHEIPFTDCRDSSFEMYISDNNFMRNSSGSNIHQPIGNACTTLIVVGTRLGSSIITVAYNVNGQYLTDNITVSAYEPLISIHPASRETLLAVGSSRKILFKGGPISYSEQQQYDIENLESYSRQITVSNNEIVKIIEHNYNDFTDIYVFEVVCQALGDVDVTLKISNEQNNFRNCQSSGATANIKVICGKPRSIHLQPEFKDSENCPIGRNTDRVMAHCEKPLNLSVTVKDDNGRIFDNITSFNIEWAFNPAGSGTTKITNGISEDTFIDYNIVFPKNHYQTIIPRQHTGTLIISSSIKEYQKSVLSKLRITPESPAFPIINYEGELETPLISADIKLILVNDTSIIPNTIKILNDPNAKYSLKVSQGSGYYEFVLSTNDIADIRYIEPTKTISIIPKKSGILQLALVDLCLVSDPAEAEIQVQQLAGIKIDSVNKVEKGKCIIAAIKLFDTNGNFIKLPSADALDLRSEVENSFIEMKPLLATEENYPDIDYQNGEILYVIHGIEEGETRITFISGNNEEEIRSESLTIQVFLPLKITQKNVTLLVGSIYQVLTTGGPINAEIEFHVDDYHQDIITNINDNDIFEGKTIGKASIIAKAVGEDLRGNRIVYSQDHVDISVNQLEGIRIITPTTRIKIGATIPLWAFGIPDHLNPLIIGSIRSNLIFSWSSSDSNILSLNNMYDGTGINIRYQNKVTLRAKALKSGIATVHLNVTTQTPIDDFTFSTSIKIDIIEELSIISPDVSQGLPVILMTPNSSLKLKTNRDRHGSTSYKIISSGQSNDFDDSNALESSVKSVTVDKTGLIKTGDTYGRTILSITNIESYNFKQLLTIVIDVKPIHYMMLSLDSSIRIRAGEELNVLPKGMELDYIVEYFDNFGNKFHATETKVGTIANRADLTTFIPHSSSTGADKITVKFHENGELVAKFYNQKYPTEMFDYVHMVIGDIVFPSKTILTVGDIVCFSMPLLASDTGEPGFWQSSEPQILTVDGMNGIGISKKPGHTIVKHSFTSKLDKKGDIEVIVQPISKISLVLLRGKNITGSQIFSVPLVLKSKDEGIKENNILARGFGGCRTQNSISIDTFPFACKLQFTSSNLASIDINDIIITKPRFDISTGFYYCDIIPIGLPTLLSSTLETKIRVEAYSRDGRDIQAKPLEISYLPPIYIDTTDIVFLQQIPQTIATATLDIHGLTSVLNHVSLEIPDGIVIDNQEFVNSNQLHLKLKLMQNRDDLQGQYLMIVNKLTMQNISMLIRISKHHDFVHLSGIHWINYIYLHRYTFITLIVLLITIIYVWKNKIASVDLSVRNNSIFADKCPPPLQKSPHNTASNSSFNATTLNNSMTPSATPRQSPDSPLRPFSAFEAVYGDPRGFYTPNVKRNISMYSS